MKQSDTEKWNKVYSKNQFGFFPPAEVLHRHQHLLPKTGKALDLACGQGRNAVHLSRHGLESHAFDISDVAISNLKQYAKDENVDIDARVVDLKRERLQENNFDVIVVSHFLDRSLFADIKNALKPQGLIFYQTFTKLKIDDIGPSNPDYLLERNELLVQFKEFKVLVYCENDDVGNTREGLRNEAMIIAQKT